MDTGNSWVGVAGTAVGAISTAVGAILGAVIGPIYVYRRWNRPILTASIEPASAARRLRRRRPARVRQGKGEGALTPRRSRTLRKPPGPPVPFFLKPARDLLRREQLVQAQRPRRQFRPAFQEAAHRPDGRQRGDV